MPPRIDDPRTPGWHYEITEVSAGVYVVEARSADGLIVTFQLDDSNANIIDEAVARALALIKAAPRPEKKE